MNIAIIGLGLIGGSYAKATKSRTLHTVYGYDLDQEVMMFARMTGAMDKALTDELLAECDLVITALRPGAALQWTRDHAAILGRAKCVLVDICGVKRAVVGEMAKIAEENGFRYIGGHPMAGKEQGGFVNATDSLFDGASMILTPDANTDLPTLETLKNYFTDIGFAHLTFSTPDEHDRIIAYTSQLAHIVSGAYVKSPTAQKRRGFSAGSFRDLTRVARLDEKMWTELMLDNREYLAEELRILIDNLKPYLEALEENDAEKLCECLREGRIAKAAAGGN
ncbi:MAG TPA: prephenate dehydrogenase/arogenate dehydrogenase family protein [Ruminococcus sp.]|nr:prephenate dehydrogenase/arogenate dehydrogenase family protein [Ruminococcus sp.]